jgi:hypothetical protein
MANEMGMFTTTQPLVGAGKDLPRNRLSTHVDISPERTESLPIEALHTEPFWPTCTLTVMLPETSPPRNARL